MHYTRRRKAEEADCREGAWGKNNIVFMFIDGILTGSVRMPFALAFLHLVLHKCV